MMCACGNLKRGVCKKRECVQLRRGANSVLVEAQLGRESDVSACEPAGGGGARARSSWFRVHAYKKCHRESPP